MKSNFNQNWVLIIAIIIFNGDIENPSNFVDNLVIISQFQLVVVCKDGGDVNEKFTDDIDAQHVDMTPLALASALNRVEHVKVRIAQKTTR